MSAGALRSIWQLAFQVSPIVLVNGLAATLPGGLLPIVAITEALDIAGGLLTGNGLPDSLDDFFAQYLPLPGSTLISQAVGQYPFANLAVAANATIKNPLNISMVMIAPARETGGYLTKLPIFTALQAALETHNSLGGLYHIATPAFVYTNCIFLSMTDVTDGESRQRQAAYQLDFQKPLVTASQLNSALNSLMSRLANGSQISGNPTWSGPAASVGTSAAGTPQLSPSSIPASIQQFDPDATIST